MKKLVLALVVLSTMVGCVNEASEHGKVTGNSHGMFFKQAKTEQAPYQCHRPTSHGGEQ
jgi:hypothetical protein